MAPPADAILVFASAFPLAVLGAALLFIRPRRAAQVFFGLFAIVWSVQILLANLGRLYEDPGLHRFLLTLAHALLPIAALFLVHFTVRVRPGADRRWASAVAGVLALLAGLTIALRPDLVVRDVVLTADGLSSHYGPLAFPLFHGVFRAAIYFALVVMYLDYRNAKPGTPRRRVRGLLLAFALYASYDTTRLLLAYALSDNGFAQFSSSAVQTAGGFVDLASTLFLLAGSALIAAIGIHVFLRPPPPEEPDAPLLLAFVFPAAVAILEEVLALATVRMETLGFWRFIAAGVIVYTLANFQLFDLELRLRRLTAPVVATVLALFGIPILLTLALGEFGPMPLLFALVPQVLGVAGVVVFQERLRNTLFPGVQDTSDYLHQRRLDIYQVALEETLARGGSADDQDLKELRLKSGISMQEHQILAWMLAAGQKSPAAAESFEEGTVVLERYRLERALGPGSYGRTFLAHDLKARRPVALKTVDIAANDGTAARLLLREARLAAGIVHPNVIQILDVAELPDRVVVVMEYAEGGNLEDHLRAKGKLAVPDAVRFLRELLAALEAVHTKRIVHRNLKPKNILIEADESVRLSDFGAAAARRHGEEGTEAATITLMDLLYQSPEQLAENQATPQSDLFVAAVLFHQAITGRYPFPIAGKSDYQIRQTIQSGALDLHTTGLPAWVRPFLERALALEPGRRFADAALMRDALETAAGLLASPRPNTPGTATAAPGESAPPV